MQYSHLVTRMGSLGICNVSSQEERKGASTVPEKKKGLVKHAGLRVFILLFTTLPVTEDQKLLHNI